MSQVFGRSASLSEKIYDIQLLIPEWKVLFALNGEMEVEDISTFLELGAEEVNAAMNRLDELGLVTLVKGASKAAAEEITEDLFMEDGADIADGLSEFDAGENDALDDVLEEMQLEQDDLTEISEESENAETAESMSDERLDEVVSEVTKEVGEEADKEAADDGDDEDGDLDSLINDLLKEDSDSDDDFSDDLLSLSDDKTAPLDEISTPEKVDTEEGDSDDDDFDLGDIFESDLSETEQSLEDVLDSFEEESEEADSGDADVVPAAEPGGKKTVLVVDDSVVIRKMVEIALENENLNIISVANGKDALSFLDKEHADIVILDIMLPDINGLDILKTIKSSKDMPVVMLSAKDTPRETTRAKELGADDFIPKPFKDEELINKIHELIGG